MNAPKRGPNRFDRVRKTLTFAPRAPDWIPDLDEKAWLEELDALTPEEIRQLDRFSPAVGGVEVVPEDQL